MTRTLALTAAALLASAPMALAQDAAAPPAGDTTQQTTDPNAPMSTAPDAGTTQPGDMTTAPADPAATPGANPNAAPGAPGQPADPNAPPPSGAPETATEPTPGGAGAAGSAGAMGAGGAMGSAGAMGGGAGFAQYDEGGKGYLTPLEFAKMHEAGMGGGDVATADKDRTSKKSGNAAVSLLNKHAAAFAQADANRDGRLTQDEMTAPSATM